MAAEGQDFAIYDLDQFTLRFNVTDANAALDNGSEDAWWGVADAVTETSLANVKMQKATSGWNPNGATQIPNNIGGMEVNANSIDCLAVLNTGSGASNYDGTITLQPTWATSQSSVEYYHELAYDDLGEQKGSTVIAVGTLTVYRSAFTEKGFRT